ncbi:MAG: guanylate kinase [Paracoccaceae bacterium]|uniref:guanylate kinase n=1 Tax=Candidatus Salinivivens marinus TaxID=3381703 RepID=UPI000B69F2AC|nr:guanylate kinase [Marinovum sp.]OUU11295.1 MAG: guanylate kinase [Rhodobacteraceae bacterium TMED38]PDH58544.1 MAG: guanylate kinase [Rhodobacteraceae bacterium MED-G08]|tara:strand:+ start:439 stop:1071 length:633 start_codon:yes stop_codon:yes gene_type:complete
MRRGLIIILSSPSGAGKSTLSDRLRAWDNDIVFSISATTREPRDGEKDGREYFFKSREDFLKMVDNQEMLEHAEVFGNLYGSPQKPVSNAIENGQDVLFDIDWQGGQQIRNSVLGKQALSLFILPPSIAELERRLNSRAKDNQDVIKNRMALARDEISHWPEYDYVLINNDLDKTENDLKTIIKAERLKLSQQPRIVDDVRNLNNEFENR